MYDFFIIRNQGVCNKVHFVVLVVSNEKDIMALNPATDGAVIASGVGKKKKLYLLNVAQQKKVRVLNVRDIPKAIATITEAFVLRVASRKKKLAEKTVKTEEKKKKADEKKKKDAADTKAGKGDSTGKESGSVDDTVLDEQEKQKEMVDKTIIKRN